MTRVTRTMSPEEEAAWVANPFAAINTVVAFAPVHKRAGPGLPEATRAHQWTRKPFTQRHAGEACSLQGCEDEATETGRCVRHEAIWLRLHQHVALHKGGTR